MKTNKEFIKENCECMLNIIKALKDCEKAEINDFELSYEACKEDLRNSLEAEE